MTHAEKVAKLMSKKYLPPLMMWLFFEAVAASLALMLDNLFYFFNFTYFCPARNDCSS